MEADTPLVRRRNELSKGRARRHAAGEIPAEMPLCRRCGRLKFRTRRVSRLLFMSYGPNFWRVM